MTLLLAGDCVIVELRIAGCGLGCPGTDCGESALVCDSASADASPIDWSSSSNDVSSGRRCCCCCDNCCCIKYKGLSGESWSSL